MNENYYRMMTLRLLTGAGMAALATGCGGSQSESTEPATDETQGSEVAVDTSDDTIDDSSAETSNSTVAVAMLRPTEGNQAAGSVRFTSTGDGVEVTIDIAGVPPNSTHGFHVHEVGDCSAADGSSAGGHYNPANVEHALPPTETRHAGDMGNLSANDAGQISATETFHNFTLEGEASIVGRAVILHADQDQGSQPSGAAGARIACGVIAAGE